MSLAFNLEKNCGKHFILQAVSKYTTFTDILQKAFSTVPKGCQINAYNVKCFTLQIKLELNYVYVGSSVSFIFFSVL